MSIFAEKSRTDPRLSAPSWFGVGCLLTTGLAAIDSASGTELSLGPFYLIPIALTSWFAGKRYGVVVSVVAALAWLVADAVAGHVYSQPHIRYWNAAVRLGYYLVVALLVPAVLARDRARASARTDSLTGAANRRRFMEEAQGELVRAKVSDLPISLIYFDLDGFKAINDRRGHRTGDAVLRAVAVTASRGLERGELLARIGGDEFAVMLPQTDSVRCREVADRLRSELLDEMATNGWPVSFSVGALTYVRGPASLDDLMSRIDALMYSVKSAGKDGVAHVEWEGARGPLGPPHT